MEGDVLRGVTRGAGDRHGREHAVLIGRGPFEHLHAAHRAAEHAEHHGNAEMIEQPRLRPHHVGDGDDGKIEPVGAAGCGIDRARPGRAHAAADHVGAEHEIAVGIDRLAGADHGLPPAGLAGDGMDVGDMLVAGQRMADEHEVRLVGVERAVGLIGDGEGREFLPAVERKRDRRKMRDLALRDWRSAQAERNGPGRLALPALHSSLSNPGVHSVRERHYCLRNLTIRR